MAPELTFDQAIMRSNDLIYAVDSGEISASDAVPQLDVILASSNGARGFFVALLTENYNLADKVPAEFIQSFSQHPEIVCDLLAKNLVMSSTMSVTHERNSDREMASKSRLVRDKTSRIISQLNTESMRKFIHLVNIAIDQRLARQIDESNQYAAFLARWNYDDEQLAEAKIAISNLGMSAI